MLNVGALRSALTSSETGIHLPSPATVAAIGLNCAHQLREAAPLVLISISRVLPHPAGTAADSSTGCQECARTCEVSIHEWDEGRWFVVDRQLGMLGEIERAASGYRVFHNADDKGAVFAFGTLALATAYFEDYAEALAL